MGRARPDLIRVLEENPPGPHAGITLVRRVRTREYRTEIGPRGHPFRVPWFKALFALEDLDLLDGDLELMGDPGIGAALADPGPDLVQLRA